MKTIAQQLNIKDFPFRIKDKNGNEIYYKNSEGFWGKREYDKNGKETYYEDSYGTIVDNRPTCSGKEVVIDGKTYILKEKK